MVIESTKTWGFDQQQNLVGGKTTPLKNMSSSVGVILFPICGKINPVMFQTNQIWILMGFNGDLMVIEQKHGDVMGKH